jgi:D-amino-acid dehydrogenase
MSETAGRAGTSPTAVVVGAGMIGVCCALFLQRDGFSVTLIDRQGPGEGASYGNGSMLTCEAVVPIQTPGIVWRVPAMLLDPLGPLRVRWGYLPRLMPWLMRFIAESRWPRVEAASIALARLLDQALLDFDPLLRQAGAEAMVRRTGFLMVYESEAGFRRAAPLIDLQRRRGVEMEILDAETLRAREPNLAPIFARAIHYPEVAQALDVFRLVQVLAESFVAQGGTLKREEVRDFVFASDNKVEAVVTDQGRHPCDALVVAAGAWSRSLVRRLGGDTLLDTERGYSVLMPDPGVVPNTPLYSTERGVVFSPMEIGLRVAGTVELGGLEAPPDWRRAEVLLTLARRWLPGLNTEGVEPWIGFRPSMPDSVPVISGSPRYDNAFFAFGHGHGGIGLGARTGRLIADLAAGRSPNIDMAPYRVDRF